MSYKIQYLTAKLQEEAAEVIQAVSKINRFGPHNSHPDRTTTNLQELVGELEDFLAIVAALEHYKYIDLTLSQQQIGNKAKALITG
jgi:NTP pyrophosphatase (non-canonical NTP hydrolase)